MANKRGFLFFGLLGVLLLVVVAILFLVPPAKYTSGFENIHEVAADANSKNELADPESYKDHRRPSWKTFHGKTQPGFLGRKINNTMVFLGLKKRPNWSSSYFKYLLEKRIKEREDKGKSSKFEYVYRIVPSEKSRFIVWGDMSGAYHSFVRALQKLIKLGILDEDLKLKSKDDYFAFMGDVASRSPFIMELLTLIMKLEEKNPDRIVYMTGNNERRGAWYPYGLREEILFKAPHLTSEAAPLYKVAERYFETLPLGIYISIPPHQNRDFVRLSHFAMETPSKETYREFLELLDDAYYSKELMENRQEGANTIIKLDKEKDAPDLERVNVRAIIKSYRKMKEYQKHPGLAYLVPDKNASAWTILSSPTVFVHKFFDFWNDAFNIVQAAPNIEDWTITLYTRDIRKKDKDFDKFTYNFLSGKEVAGVEKKEETVMKTNKNMNRRLRHRRR